MTITFDEAGRIIVPTGILSERILDENTFLLDIRGIRFFLDEEGDKKFHNEFNSKGQAYTSKKGYLMRKENKKAEYFHRWLMNQEIKDFSKENNIEEKNIEVHHLNNNKDNRKENLICIAKKGHKELHTEERSWNHYRKRMAQFWRKEKGEEYYREKFHRYWCLNNKLI